MKVLIIGDTGFIGKNLKEYLIKKRYQVIGFSKSRGQNLLHYTDIEKKIKNCDIIINCGAIVQPHNSIFSPKQTLENNINGTINVLESCRKYKKPLIHTSTSLVYGNSKNSIKEDHPHFPATPYAASKSCVDNICMMYNRVYDLDIRIVRYFNVYGPNQSNDKIIPNFCKHAQQNLPLTIYGNGKNFRDYVYITDITEGTWKARKLRPGTIINLCSGKKTATIELAKLIIKKTESNSNIKLLDFPKGYGGVDFQVGNLSKAKRLLNWEPKVLLSQGINKMLS